MHVIFDEVRRIVINLLKKQFLITDISVGVRIGIETEAVRHSKFTGVENCERLSSVDSFFPTVIVSCVFIT